MYTIRTKDGLLNRIYQDLDESQIQELAEELNSNPLMPFKVKTKGDVENILLSLKSAPKELLEDAYLQFIEADEDEDDEEFDEDDIEYFEEVEEED